MHLFAQNCAISYFSLTVSTKSGSLKSWNNNHWPARNKILFYAQCNIYLGHRHKIS